MLPPRKKRKAGKQESEDCVLSIGDLTPITPSADIHSNVSSSAETPEEAEELLSDAVSVEEQAKNACKPNNYSLLCI